MKLIDKSSGETIEAVIVELIIGDYKNIKKNPGFSFDWGTEKNYEVYKIHLLDDDKEMLGIMSLIDIPEEYRVHLNLLEVTKSQQGKNKQIDGIAGCLIAFAAETAVKRGYYGFVSLEPKTQLIDYYQDKYGFKQYGRYLGIEGTTSQILINKYLGND